MMKEKQLASGTKDSQKRNEARRNVKDRMRVREEGVSVHPEKCVSPLQLSDQHEGKQAGVMVDAAQVLDAGEALPTPPSREQTTKERHYLAKHEKREDNAPPSPLFKFENDVHGERTEMDHPNAVIGKKLLMEALGTASPAFFGRLKDQLVDSLEADNEEGVKDLNFVLSLIVAGRPEDELETMLLADMALVSLTVKRDVKEVFRRQREIHEMRDVRSYPSRSKPRDPGEQKNERFLIEELALVDTAHRGIEKMAQTHARLLLALPSYRIKKAIAKKLSASEDLSSEPPINDNYGVDKGGAADRPVPGSKVVPLRRGGKP